MADLTTFIPVRQQAARAGRDVLDRARRGHGRAVDIRTEDVATILLRFESGARGPVAVSQLSPGRKNSLQYEIDGSSSAVAWDSEQPEQLWIGHRDRPNELLLRNPALMNARPGGRRGLPGGHVEGFADTFGALFMAIYEDVAAGRPAAAPRYRDVRGRPRRDAGRRRDRRERATGAWVDVVATRSRGRVRRFSAMIRRRAGHDTEGSPR